MRLVGWLVVIGLVVFAIGWILGWFAVSAVEGGSRPGFAVEFDRKDFDEDTQKARRSIEQLGQPEESSAAKHGASAEAGEHTVTGDLVAIDAQQRTIEVRNQSGEVQTWSLAAAPELTLQGLPAALTAMRAGDAVSLSIRDGRVQRITATRLD